MRVTKTKIAVAVATTAVVALGSTAAYAYFTTGGSGTGSASTGNAVPLTATISVAGTLVPDSAAHALSYTITNSASFAQHASNASIAISSITASGGGPLLNSVCDYVLTQPIAPAAGYTFPANSTVTVPASAATGTIKMVDNGTDQSACEGATVNLTGTIS